MIDMASFLTNTGNNPKALLQIYKKMHHTSNRMSYKFQLKSWQLLTFGTTIRSSSSDSVD